MVILIGGEKGGTGKTTIATNLAALRALAGHDVLLVDTDSQGSASYGRAPGTRPVSSHVWRAFRNSAKAYRGGSGSCWPLPGRHHRRGRP